MNIKKETNNLQLEKRNNILWHRKKKIYIYIYIAQTIKFVAEKQRSWRGRKEKIVLKGSFQFYL